MVNVNFTLWTTIRCGGVRAVFEIANRLSLRGYKVQITSLMGDHRWFEINVPINYAEPPRVFRLIEPYINLRYHRSMHFGDIQNLRLYFGLDHNEPLINATPDCDINVATWNGTSIAVWFSGKGRPYFFMQDFYEQLPTPRDTRLFEAALKMPFYFLANSSYTQKIILKLQPTANVSIANVGVDTNIFHNRGNKSPSHLKRPTVMAIIREGHYKGGDIAIEVLNRINGKIPIHASLVGSWDTIKTFFTNKRIHFSYTVNEKVNDNDLALLYSSADLFLFTSRVEGFGLPPLESMACGTTVVTTECGGNMDYAIDSYNCLMSPCDDVQRLSELAIKIIVDETLRNQLIRGGIETAKKFSWDRTCDKFENAFRIDM